MALLAINFGKILMNTVNILIPMAGKGTRFKSNVPKPYYKIDDKELFRHAIQPFEKFKTTSIKPKYIFVIREEHKEYINDFPRQFGNNYEVVYLNVDTRGAAETCLAAYPFINNDIPLFIGNSDHYFSFDLQTFIWDYHRKFDGVIFTYHSNHPNNSYVTLDPETKLVTHCYEKQVVSDIATNGVYYFKSGREFIWAAEEMIKKDIRTNNEFYVCPVYNELIAKNKKIAIFPTLEHYPLGTIEEVEKFKEMLYGTSYKLL